MVSTATEIPQVGLVDPADWFPRHDCMEGRQGVMGPDTWSATKRAREKILLIDGGQDIGDATRKDPVADARDLHSTLPHGPNRLRNPSRSPIRIIRSPANASISSVSAEGPIRTSLSAWP